MDGIIKELSHHFPPPLDVMPRSLYWGGHDTGGVCVQPEDPVGMSTWVEREGQYLVKDYVEGLPKIVAEEVIVAVEQIIVAKVKAALGLDEQEILALQSWGFRFSKCRKICNNIFNNNRGSALPCA